MLLSNVTITLTSNEGTYSRHTKLNDGLVLNYISEEYSISFMGGR
jgi:hypothetical protein